MDAFCRRVVDFQRWEGEGAVVVDCEEAQAALAAAGMVVVDPDARLREDATELGIAPSGLIEALSSGG